MAAQYTTIQTKFIFPFFSHAHLNAMLVYFNAMLGQKDVGMGKEGERSGKEERLSHFLYNWGTALGLLYVLLV